MAFGTSNVFLLQFFEGDFVESKYDLFDVMKMLLFRKDKEIEICVPGSCQKCCQLIFSGIVETC